MNDLDILLRTVLRYAFFFMSACLLVWAFIPQWRPYATGLVLGCSISLVNAWILRVKIRELAEAVMANEGKRVGIGYVSRICMVLIGTMICLKFPQINLISTVCGFFFVQFATIVKGLADWILNK